MAQDKIPLEIAQAAVEWQLELMEADHQASVRQSIADWCEQHPDHARAWQRIEQMGGVFQPLAGKQGGKLAQSTISNVPVSRRSMLKQLALIVAVGGASSWAYQRQPWQPLLADLATDLGQQKTVTLQDGSALSLNSDSAVRISMSDGQRSITLLRGEIHVETSSHTEFTIPLEVHTSMGTLQPLGTRFSVRKFDDKVRLGVYKGRVMARTQSSGFEQIIDAGTALYFDDQTLGPIRSVSDQEAAWVRGVIVASNMSMQDFLAELERHRAGIIQHDPAVSHLRISGTYPLDATSKVLDSLPSVLPVRIKYLSRYWVRILPAE